MTGEECHVLLQLDPTSKSHELHITNCGKIANSSLSVGHMDPPPLVPIFTRFVACFFSKQCSLHRCSDEASAIPGSLSPRHRPSFPCTYLLHTLRRLTCLQDGPCCLRATLYCFLLCRVQCSARLCKCLCCFVWCPSCCNKVLQCTNQKVAASTVRLSLTHTHARTRVHTRAHACTRRLVFSAFS